MTLAVDISNYTTPLTPDALAAWRKQGVELVIVQSVQPPTGFPPSQTKAQIEACDAAGLQVDAYIWLWFDLDQADIASKLALLDGLNIRRLWLDVEDTASQKYDQHMTEAKVTEALALCDAHPHTDPALTGLYTGRWFWTNPHYLDNSTAFSTRDLWDAAYDGQVTLEGFNAYGGWTTRAIHQYAGTSTLSGVGNVDLNVLDLAERVLRETPDSWQWLTWQEAALNYKGIADELGRQIVAIRAALTAPTAHTTT